MPPRLPQFFLTLFFSLSFLLTVSSAADQDPTPTPQPRLLFVAELCRHGDRSPLAEFPADALPVSKWPEGVGELTAIGQRAHFDLGTRLRARYVDTDFLPTAFSPTDIYVRSTDIDRTLASATSQMAGLYPPGTAPNDDVRVRFGKDALHDNEGGLPHRYQPVPIHTTSKETDFLLLPGANCPRHDILMKEKQQSSTFKDKIAEEHPFFETAAMLAGRAKTNFTIFDMEHLSDTWTCFAAHSVPLPQGATPEIVDRAKNVSNWLLTFGNEGLEVNRLRAGLILHEIKLRMIAAALRDVNKLPPEFKYIAKKFVLLSAHDSTLAATLAAMQVFSGVNPPYNSTIFWEMYKAADNSFLVRIEFNGKPLTLPGCSDEYCPISEYFDSTFDRTVPGESARFFECLTGWRRYAAMVTNLFNRRQEGLDYLRLTKGDQRTDSRSSVGVVILISALAFVVVVAALGSSIRMRARYKGYSPPVDEQNLSQYGTRVSGDGVSDRPILM